MEVSEQVCADDSRHQHFAVFRCSALAPSLSTVVIWTVVVLTTAFARDRLGRAWELGGADVRALGMGHGTPGMGGPRAWPAVGSEI